VVVIQRAVEMVTLLLLPQRRMQRGECVAQAAAVAS